MKLESFLCRPFLARCRSFQVVSCSLKICFRLFLARCRSFQVVPRFSKYFVFFLSGFLTQTEIYVKYIHNMVKIRKCKTSNVYIFFAR